MMGARRWGCRCRCRWRRGGCLVGGRSSERLSGRSEAPRDCGV